MELVNRENTYTYIHFIFLAHVHGYLEAIVRRFNILRLTEIAIFLQRVIYSGVIMSRI